MVAILATFCSHKEPVLPRLCVSVEKEVAVVSKALSMPSAYSRHHENRQKDAEIQDNGVKNIGNIVTRDRQLLRHQHDSQLYSRPSRTLKKPVVMDGSCSCIINTPTLRAMIALVAVTTLVVLDLFGPLPACVVKPAKEYRKRGGGVETSVLAYNL